MQEVNTYPMLRSVKGGKHLHILITRTIRWMVRQCNGRLPLVRNVMCPRVVPGDGDGWFKGGGKRVPARVSTLM